MKGGKPITFPALDIKKVGHWHGRESKDRAEASGGSNQAGTVGNHPWSDRSMPPNKSHLKKGANRDEGHAHRRRELGKEKGTSARRSRWGGRRGKEREGASPLAS